MEFLCENEQQFGLYCTRLKNLYTLNVQAHLNDILYRHRFLKRRRGEVAGALGEELCQALIADVLNILSSAG